ncbi:MAG: aquaporin [Planctomycetota bacterium]|nr:aquaporin [Planctomycetota bacterium]
MSNIAKEVAEAIGTFALCFVGGGAICIATMQGAGYAGLLGVAMAHGLVLSVAVSATMNISGAHLNPAVTIAMLATKRIDGGGAVRYILAQLIGGTIAGALLLAMFQGVTTTGGDEVVQAAKLGTPHFEAPITAGRAILIEVPLTFLLVFAIFGTAVDPRAPKIGGFGIGLAVAADILIGGPLTGAAMNPARTFGTGIVAALSGNLDVFWKQHYVYWIGPIVGALLAAFTYDKLIMEKRA